MTQEEILKFTPPGKRGRPPVTWNKQIQEDIEFPNFKEGTWTHRENLLEIHWKSLVLAKKFIDIIETDGICRIFAIMFQSDERESNENLIVFFITVDRYI